MVGRAGRWALAWCLPFALLGLAWAFSNPPGAAPDEKDHLVKAIGAGRLDIGTEFEGSLGNTPGAYRNASIARVIEVPARIDPSRYNCTAFKSDVTADCLPVSPPFAEPGEMVEVVTPVGAYPVFMYVPMGLAANLAESPEQAFHLARLANLAMCTGLLALGAWHLGRTQGRWAASGLVLALTPMALFAAATVSASGVEITSAATVAAVTVAAIRDPETLAERRTLWVLGIAGSVLLVSRQFGVLAFGTLALITLATGGAPVLWRELRGGNRMLIGAGIALATSTALVLWWEATYDNPALTGRLLAPGAFEAWLQQLPFYVESAIGRFGWLDTPIPAPLIWLYLVVLAVVLAAALRRAAAAPVLAILFVCAVLLLVSYATHAVIFYPVQASLQGRHLLSMYVVVPMLAVVLLPTQRPEPRSFPTTARVGVLVALAMPLLHAGALYANGRRYAVGVSGPIWFPPDAAWTPPGGWALWLVTGGLGAALLGAMVIRVVARPEPPRAAAH